VVPHRSTNRARQCLTSQSERDAVLSLLYGRSWKTTAKQCIKQLLFQQEPIHRRKTTLIDILLAIMGQGWSSAAAPPEVVRIHNCVCARARELCHQPEFGYVRACTETISVSL
jgi:hypothetical protein